MSYRPNDIAFRYWSAMRKLSYKKTGEQVRFGVGVEEAALPAFEKQDRKQLWFAHTSNPSA